MINVPALNTIEDGNFDPLPIGKYQVEIIEAKEDNKDAEKPKLKVKFEVVAGEQSGKYIFKDFVLTEKAWWAFKPFLLALGCAEDKELELQAEDFVGEQLILSNYHRIYDGKTYNDPKNFISLKSAGAEREEKIPF